MTLSAKALQIADFFHKGQTRWDKSVPYITHPIMVARNAKEMAPEFLKGFEWIGIPEEIELLTLEDIFEVIDAASLLHDVYEDCKHKGVTFRTIERKLSKVAPKRQVDATIVVLKLVSKDENETSYFNYLERIKGNILAKLVKLADIKHNLSDLKPGKLRDKYLLARHYLTH